MSDFNVRSDSVDVEQLMEQIRARIREKRGVDYTEQQLHELAAVKLERFLDPRGVRSSLLERYRQVQADREPPALPNYIFGETTLYQTHRAPIRWIRRLLQPLLKLFFNPNALIQALHIQSNLNTMLVERESARHGFDQLHFEVIHNLVVETTRLGIDVKNLKMQVESLASRLEFNERRTRALESAVAFGPAAGTQEVAPAAQAAARPRPIGGAPAGSFEAGAGSAPIPAAVGSPEGPGQRSRRRRRRRGRRGGGPATAMMGQPSTDASQATSTPSTGSGSSEGPSDPRASSPGGPAPAGEAHATEPMGGAGSTPASQASAGSGSTEPGPDQQ